MGNFALIFNFPHINEELPHLNPCSEAVKTGNTPFHNKSQHTFFQKKAYWLGNPIKRGAHI